MASLKALFPYLLIRLATLAAITLSGIVPLCAQQPGPPSDQQTLQLLLKRIDQLEARVQQLEAEKARPPQGESNASAPSRSCASMSFSPKTKATNCAYRWRRQTEIEQNF